METHEQAFALRKAREIHGLLANFPENGKLRKEDWPKGVVMDAITTGLIQNVDVKKRCPTCGTDRHDYSYFRITMAGTLLLAVLNATSEPHP